jgi:hypothetical protein
MAIPDQTLSQVYMEKRSRQLQRTGERRNKGDSLFGDKYPDESRANQVISELPGITLEPISNEIGSRQLVSPGSPPPVRES